VIGSHLAHGGYGGHGTSFNTETRRKNIDLSVYLRAFVAPCWSCSVSSESSVDSTDRLRVSRVWEWPHAAGIVRKCFSVPGAKPVRQANHLAVLIPEELIELLQDRQCLRERGHHADAAIDRMLPHRWIGIASHRPR
jgi:hypothetical protein